MIDETDLWQAGFCRRAVAWLTDAALCVLIGIFLAVAVGGLSAVLLTYGVFVLYSAVSEASPYHATLGKLLLGLWVSDLEGRAVSPFRAVGRTIAKQVSMAVFPLGHLIAPFTDGKQALHDLLASTHVLQHDRNR